MDTEEHFNFFLRYGEFSVSATKSLTMLSLLSSCDLVSKVEAIFSIHSVKQGDYDRLFRVKFDFYFS